MKPVNLLLLGVSLTLGLFLVELMLWIVGRPPAHPLQVAHPVNYTEQRENIEFNYQFSTNSRGLRYEEIPLSKPDGETRFFVLGDSYAEGYGLETGQRFTSLLEQRFTNERDGTYRFINGGLTGTGPLAYWKMMFRVGLEYHPDHIVVCLFANDLSNIVAPIERRDLDSFYYTYYDELPLQRRIPYQIFPRLYVLLSDLVGNIPGKPQAAKKERRTGFLPTVERFLEGQNISRQEYEAWKQKLDPELLEHANKGLIDWSVLAYSLLRRRYWYEALDIESLNAEKKYSSMIFVLDHMVKVARERGIKISFLFLPIRYQYDPKSFESDHPWIKAGMVDKRWLNSTTEVQRRLRLWSEDRKVSFHDLTPRFREEARKGRPLNFEIDGHWNAAGHAVAADEIGRWILEDESFDLE